MSPRYVQREVTMPWHHNPNSQLLWKNPGNAPENSMGVPLWDFPENVSSAGSDRKLRELAATGASQLHGFRGSAGQNLLLSDNSEIKASSETSTMSSNLTPGLQCGYPLCLIESRFGA